MRYITLLLLILSGPVFGQQNQAIMQRGTQSVYGVKYFTNSNLIVNSQTINPNAAASYEQLTNGTGNAVTNGGFFINNTPVQNGSSITISMVGTNAGGTNNLQTVMVTGPNPGSAGGLALYDIGLLQFNSNGSANATAIGVDEQGRLLLNGNGNITMSATQVNLGSFVIVKPTGGGSIALMTINGATVMVNNATAPLASVGTATYATSAGTSTFSVQSSNANYAATGVLASNALNLGGILATGYVTVAGTNIITGYKQFTTSPVVPNATETNHAVNLGQLADYSFSTGDVSVVLATNVFFQARVIAWNLTGTGAVLHVVNVASNIDYLGFVTNMVYRTNVIAATNYITAICITNTWLYHGTNMFYDGSIVHTQGMTATAAFAGAVAMGGYQPPRSTNANFNALLVTQAVFSTVPVTNDFYFDVHGLPTNTWNTQYAKQSGGASALQAPTIYPGYSLTSYSSAIRLYNLTNELAKTYANTNGYWFFTGNPIGQTNSPVIWTTNGFCLCTTNDTRWFGSTNTWPGGGIGPPVGTNYTVSFTVGYFTNAIALTGTPTNWPFLRNRDSAALTLTNGTTATNLVAAGPLTVNSSYSNSFTKVVIAGQHPWATAGISTPISITTTDTADNGELVFTRYWQTNGASGILRTDVFNCGWDIVDPSNYPSFIPWAIKTFPGAGTLDLNAVFVAEPYLGALVLGGRETPQASITMLPMLTNQYPTVTIRQQSAASELAPALKLIGAGTHYKHVALEMGGGAGFAGYLRFVTDPETNDSNNGGEFQMRQEEFGAFNGDWSWRPFAAGPTYNANAATGGTAGHGFTLLHHNRQTNTVFYWDNNAASLVSIGTTNRDAVLSVGGAIAATGPVTINGHAAITNEALYLAHSNEFSSVVFSNYQPPRSTNENFNTLLATQLVLSVQVNTNNYYLAITGLPTNTWNTMYGQKTNASGILQCPVSYSGYSASSGWSTQIRLINSTNLLAQTYAQTNGYWYVSGNALNATNSPVIWTTNGFCQCTTNDSNWYRSTNSWPNGMPPVGVQTTISFTVGYFTNTLAWSGTPAMASNWPFVKNYDSAQLTLTNGSSATNLLAYGPLTVNSTYSNNSTKVIINGRHPWTGNPAVGLAVNSPISITTTSETDNGEIVSTRYWQTNGASGIMRTDVFVSAWDVSDTSNSPAYVPWALKTFPGTSVLDVASVSVAPPAVGVVFFGGRETPHASFTFSPPVTNAWPTVTIRNSSSYAASNAPTLKLQGTGANANYSSLEMGGSTFANFRIQTDPHLTDAITTEFSMWTDEAAPGTWEWRPFAAGPSYLGARGFSPLHWGGTTNTTFWWDANASSLVSIGTTNRNATLSVGGGIAATGSITVNGQQVLTTANTFHATNITVSTDANGVAWLYSSQVSTVRVASVLPFQTDPDSEMIIANVVDYRTNSVRVQFFDVRISVSTPAKDASATLSNSVVFYP